MKKIITAALLTLAFSACGGGYQPPPQANTTKLPPSSTKTTSPAKKTPTGPSYVQEFQQEYDLAKSAFQEYRTAYKNDDNAGKVTAYAKQGTHYYKALWYRISHEKNGHEADLLRGLTQFNKDYKDWRASMGQVDKKWEQDPDYKAAKEAFDKLGSGGSLD